MNWLCGLLRQPFKIILPIRYKKALQHQVALYDVCTTRKLYNNMTLFKPVERLYTSSLYPKFRRSQMVADTLRSMIDDGRLRTGDKLPTETDLCKEFEVSRTTLREATQMLRSEGLLDVTPGRGSFVCRPNMRERLDAFAMAVRGDSTLNKPEAYEVLGHILIPLLPQLCRRPEPVRHALLATLMQPRLTAQDNTDMECAWIVDIAEKAQAPMAGMMCKVILTVLYKERLRALGREDACHRFCHAQLRVANSLVGGDVEVTSRLLTHYLDMMAGSVGDIALSQIG